MNDYLVKIKKVIIDPSTFSATEMLSSLDEDIFVNNTILKVITDPVTSITKDKCNIGQDVYNDVEFFKCFTEKNSYTIFDKINTCTLNGSKDMLKKFFEEPDYNVDLLTMRQGILKSHEEISKSNEKLMNFDNIKSYEKDVLWMFEELDQNLKDLYEMVFFRFCLFKPLNKNPYAITANNVYKIMCSPIVGILTPILYIIVPYMIIIYKLKIKIPFKTYIKIMLSTLMSGDIFVDKGNSSYKIFKGLSYVFSIIFYFQGIFNSFEISKTLYKVSKHIVEKVNNIVSFLKHANEVIKVFWNNNIKEAFLTSDIFVDTAVEDKYISSLEIMPFSIRSNFGKQLHTYITFDKNIIKSILAKIYIIESLSSIIDFKNTMNISYVKYIKSSKPLIKLQNSFHPSISLDKVVKNDIHLETNNAILTGPNAGGKSTFVKSLIINALLSQTIGICIAEHGEITPFYIINSQINIPDCKGYESLFEAEMYRCKEKLDLIKTCDNDKFALYIMDEIFNSTNPVEGIAGAYAIAKKISDYDNCLLLFTTHYVYLTKLKKTGKFINYKMNILKKDGKIEYPYKLVPGVSKQYIALDLLAKNGFDDDIIKEAITIKDRLTIRV